MFEASDDHLRLLFEFGLGQGDGGPWRRRLGEAHSRRPDVADQLIWPSKPGPGSSRDAAESRGGSEPSRQWAPHPPGPDRARVGPAHRQYRAGRSAGRRRARPPADLDPVDPLLAAALAGDADAVRTADPRLLADARLRRPLAVAEAVEFRRPEAIGLLVAAGFSVDGDGRTTPRSRRRTRGIWSWPSCWSSSAPMSTGMIRPSIRLRSAGPTRSCWRGGGLLRSVSATRPRSAGPPGPADPG